MSTSGEILNQLFNEICVDVNKKLSHLDEVMPYFHKQSSIRAELRKTFERDKK